ncbi:sulfurtransferase TusA family protein [Phycicoccus endophyticus]|uniref:sulfurtransferase TusA family protein n=1 Tax=Phycicoccus endophyticus TaxID=1690220 RepID=UPI001408D3C4|nr:sulfurtransferase TusA family protein [Phycicoccus endophyticus]NHI20934.1 sulfurtransferase TusA family protein [Phycicoccus endophyticus]GGL22445.1 hypothetical protein GCM10012283_00580 [Phycicoccus endophyticus]
MSAEHVVDARGTRCPVPVVLAARAAAPLSPGEVLVLLADDPVAVTDVPAWAWLRGHTVTAREEEGWTRYTVVVGVAEARST